MKVLVVRDGVMTLQNVRSDNAVRKILDGGIETIYLDSGMTLKMMINESSKLIKMPQNWQADKIIDHYRIDTGTILGPVVLAGISADDGTTCSISPEQLDEIYSIFSLYNPHGFYEKWFSQNRSRLAQIVDDPDGLVFTWNGHISGTYLIEIAFEDDIIIVPAYIGQAGKFPGHPTWNIHHRLLQHLKRWFGGYSAHYLGVAGLDRYGQSLWKIRIRLLNEEENPEKRHKLEGEYISLLEPYLQDHSGKYEYYKTGNIDSCILHKYRKQAFEQKVAQFLRK